MSEDEKPKMRKFWEGDIQCTSCHAPNHVKLEKKVIVPAEPAETEIVVTVTTPLEAFTQ